MEATVTDTRINTFNKESKHTYEYVGCICALFSLLILGRAWNDLFFYIFAGVSLIIFAVSSIKHCIPLLLFLLPFSTILKPNVDAISFFTVLFFVTILKMIIENLNIDPKIVLLGFLLLIYNCIFSGIGELTTIITMVAGLLLLYYIRQIQIDVNVSVISYSLGICVASVFAMLKSYFPIVNNFVADSTIKLGENNYSVRFSGLQGNPNYYTLDIILALAAIIVLMYNGTSKRMYTVCIVALSVFGLMSVSKSFLLTWVLLLLCWFTLSVKQGLSKLMKFIFIATIGIMVVYFFAYDYINAYLLRFLTDETGTIGDFTTGRTDIWIIYLKSIFSDPKKLFFGNGLNTVLETVKKGTHNTYLESIFSLGILGTVLFFTSIKASIGKVSLKKAVWLPVAVLVIRMVAIGILTYDNLWFYLMLIVALSIEKRTDKQIRRRIE